jgi:hypothetical protein
VCRRLSRRTPPDTIRKLDADLTFRQTGWPTICDPSGPRSPRSTRSAQQLDAGGAADLYFMSDLESAGAQLGTELILAMLAARVPLMLLPHLAGFEKPAARSDFSAGDQYC